MNRFQKVSSTFGQRWLGVAAVALAVAAAGAIPGSAQAELAPPTSISSCTTITKSGFYRVTKNLTAASNKDCIDVSASNVTLDLHQFTISGKNVIGGSGATGVNILSGKQFVVLEGANSFINGFDIGVQDQGNYATIEDLNTVNNFTTGIWLNGVSYSQLSNFSTYRGDPSFPAEDQAYGIRVTLSYSAAIAVGISENNEIYGVWIDRSNATRVNNVFSENNVDVSIYLGCASDSYNPLVGSSCPMSKTYGGNSIFDNTTDNDDPLAIGGPHTDYGIGVDKTESLDQIFQNESLDNGIYDISAAGETSGTFCKNNNYFLNNSVSTPGTVSPSCVGFK
jgi:hypothetical protein